MHNVAELEDRLSRPSAALIADRAALDGDYPHLTDDSFIAQQIDSWMR